MPYHWVDRLAVAGTLYQACEALRQRATAGATSVVLVPVGLDAIAALESRSGVLATAPPAEADVATTKILSRRYPPSGGL